MKRRHLWIICELVAVLGLTCGQPRQAMNTIYKSASLGGQQVLPCEVIYPPHQDDLEFVVTWRKGSLGLDHVLLTKVDGYSPTIQKEYQDRLNIVNKASLQISYIEAKDQDWYECAILFTNGKKETPINNTWIYLTVHSPPHIVRSSGTLLHVAKGDSVKLFCDGKGSPEPKVTWTKDGQPLNTTMRLTVDKSEVRIVNVQREDGGIYVCMFSNIVGDRSQPIKLVIEGGPYIMTLPGNQTVLEGQRVVFPCGTEGYPSTIVHTWYRDQSDMRTTESYKAGRITIMSDGSLVIKSAIKSDKGWFTCRPSNGLGQDEASAYLNVVYKPIVLPLPSQLIWAKGYRQQIDCPVDSNPPVQSIIWVKDQEQVHSNDRLEVLSNGTLVVTDVIEADAGSYRCTPENAMGQGHSSNRVQVLVRGYTSLVRNYKRPKVTDLCQYSVSPENAVHVAQQCELYAVRKDPPEITTSPQMLYVRNVGETVVMNCEATGIPTISLQWIKVGGHLDSRSNRIKVTDRYIEIQNLTKEDHGKYECRAINAVATVVSVTELRVNKTTPHAPVNVSVVPGLFNVTVSWEPAYDGGAPQFYILWFKKTTHSEWITIHVPGPAVTFFHLYNLQPDTEYEFKILTRNSFGNGSFSDVIRERTLGFSPDAASVLPTDQDGIPYYPEINDNHGPQPSAPLNVTAYVRGRDILVKWRTPATSPVPIFSYRVEYQLDGKLQAYNRRILGNMSNSVTLPNMPGGTYNIWVRSYGALAYSPLSNSVRVKVLDGASQSGENAGASTSSDGVVITQALVGGIIGGVLFLLVAILLALVAVFYSRRKERKAKEKNYNGVIYGKPHEMNGRYPEPTTERDHWQHNGRGDLVTTLDNTDSIFFLPQAHTLDHQPMRSSLLLDRKDDREHLCGRGVSDGEGRDQNHDQQVPLTNQSSFIKYRSQPLLLRSKPGQTRLKVRNVTWPNQQNNTSFQDHFLLRSLPSSYNNFPQSYFPSHNHPHLHKYQKQSPTPQGHSSMSRSHSAFSCQQNKGRQCPPGTSQHQRHSTHIPPSLSYPSYFQQFHPSYSSSDPSPLHSTSHIMSATPRQPQNQLHPKHVPQGTDVSRSLPLLSGHKRVPDKCQVKHSEITYSTTKNAHGHHPIDMSAGLRNVSHVVNASSEQPSQSQPSISKICIPSSHSLNSFDRKKSINIPEHLFSTGCSTRHSSTVIHNKKHFNSHRINCYSSEKSSDSAQNHQQRAIHQHDQSTPKNIYQKPLPRLSQKPRKPGSSYAITQSRLLPSDCHSQVPHPQYSSESFSNYYSTSDGNDNDERLQREDQYYKSNVLSELCHPDVPHRSWADGERKHDLHGPSHSGGGDRKHDLHGPSHSGGSDRKYDLHGPSHSGGGDRKHDLHGPSHSSGGDRKHDLHGPSHSGGGDRKHDLHGPSHSGGGHRKYDLQGPSHSGGGHRKYDLHGPSNSGGGHRKYDLHGPSHSGGGNCDRTLNVSNGGRPPYSSASYPDVSLPQQGRGSSAVRQRCSQFPYRDVYSQNYPRSMSHDPHTSLSDYNKLPQSHPPQCQRMPSNDHPYHCQRMPSGERGKTVASFHQRHIESCLSKTYSRARYKVPQHECPDHKSSHHKDHIDLSDYDSSCNDRLSVAQTPRAYHHNLHEGKKQGGNGSFISKQEQRKQQRNIASFLSNQEYCKEQKGNTSLLSCQEQGKEQRDNPYFISRQKHSEEQRGSTSFHFRQEEDKKQIDSASFLSRQEMTKKERSNVSSQSRQTQDSNWNRFGDIKRRKLNKQNDISGKTYSGIDSQNILIDDLKDDFRNCRHPDSKDDFRSSHHPDSKYDFRSSHDPGSKDDFRSNHHPDSKDDFRSSHHPDSKDDFRSSHHPDSKDDFRSCHHPDNTSDFRSSHQPESKHDFRSIHHPDSKDDFNSCNRQNSRSGCVSSSEAYLQEDTTIPQARKQHLCPDFECRLQRLREEFRLYKQQKHSKSCRGMLSTAAAAISTEISTNPLYPMDSEML